MIKFFKKIRQSLLAQGKTSQYLKYAVGEIFLVVIGILIALQVNDWNEQRKLGKANELLKQKLIGEVERNINLLSSLDTAIFLNIPKAIGMSKIAEQTGLSRPSLYKALSENAKPQFDTILKVLRAIGGNLKLKPSG